MVASSSRDNDGMAAAAKAISGMGAGVLSTMLCSPLDVAKTRVQVQTAGGGDVKYRGVLGALSTILREEGLAGWFRGIAPAVSSVAVFWAVYFPCYDAAKEKVVDVTGLDGMLSKCPGLQPPMRSPPQRPTRWPKAPSGPERSTLAARMPRRRLWWSSGAWADLTAFGHAGLPATSSLVHCSAAALAGGLTDVMTNPLWLVRTRMATSRMRAEVDGAKAAAGEAVVAGSVVAGRMAAGRVGGAAAKEARGRVPCTEAAEYATMASTIRTIARDEGMVRAWHATRHAPRPTRRTPQAPTSCTTCRLSPLSWQAGFFKGLQASFLGLSHIMIQFPLYEALKRDLVRPADGGGGGGGGGGGTAAGGNGSVAGGAGVCGGGGGGGGGAAEPSKPGVWPIVAAAAISKLIASSITYPHEVIRSRLQFDRSGEMCVLPG